MPLVMWKEIKYIFYPEAFIVNLTTLKNPFFFPPFDIIFYKSELLDIKSSVLLSGM